MERPKILPNILYAIGNTPLVKLNKIPQSMGIKCEVLAKVEFFNPGGSVKDRIGFRMVEDAELSGRLKPGCTIVEPTSGNTGLGLAVAAAVKGYRCIIVIPEKMSNEKVDTLRALGAEIVRTPLTAGSDDPEGPIAVANRLEKEIPNAVVLDQYKNPGNPLAHYDNTALEIYESCDGKVDMLVAGAGTGGTLTGCGRFFKEKAPNCKIIGVDPEGSILAQPDSLNKSDVTFYEVEGIGYDFIPTALDRSVVDEWVKVNDKISFPMARRLILEEGILCGGSSGSALAAALIACKDLTADQRCVVILPDGVRNYMTKFLSDSWMEARDFAPSENTNNLWWWEEKVAGLQLQAPPTVVSTTTCADTLTLMSNEQAEHIPVLSSTGTIEGVTSATPLMKYLVNGKVQAEDEVLKTIHKTFIRVTPDTNLGRVSRILESEAYAVVVESDQKSCSPSCKKETILGIVTIGDLLQYISEKASSGGSVTSSGSNESGLANGFVHKIVFSKGTIQTTTTIKE